MLWSTQEQDESVKELQMRFILIPVKSNCVPFRDELIEEQLTKFYLRCKENLC